MKTILINKFTQYLKFCKSMIENEEVEMNNFVVVSNDLIYSIGTEDNKPIACISKLSPVQFTEEAANELLCFNASNGLGKIEWVIMEAKEYYRVNAEKIQRVIESLN